MEIIISLIIGFVIGWYIHGRILMINMLANPTNMIKLLQAYNNAPDEDEDGKEVVECIVEKDQNQFYLYNKIDHTFLVQSTSIESALDNLHEKFPTKIFRGLIPADKAEEWGLSKQ
jgi:hypothetical protein